MNGRMCENVRHDLLTLLKQEFSDSVINL